MLTDPGHTGTGPIPDRPHPYIFHLPPGFTYRGGVALSTGLFYIPNYTVLEEEDDDDNEDDDNDKEEVEELSSEWLS